jgi:Fe-S cluster assembly iron-binding protein IscA
MLQITDGAMARMQKALSQDAVSDNECFRIVVARSGVQLIRHEASPNDVAYSTPEGKVVLAVDAATGEFLKDRTIDYDEARSALVFA